MVRLLCRQRTLAGHVQLFIQQHTQDLLGRAALDPFSTQSVFVLGIALTHVQDPARGLAELHKVHMGPASQAYTCFVCPDLSWATNTALRGVSSSTTCGFLRELILLQTAGERGKH